MKEIKGASLRVASDLTGVTGVQTEALKRRCGSTRTKKKPQSNRSFRGVRCACAVANGLALALNRRFEREMIAFNETVSFKVRKVG